MTCTVTCLDGSVLELRPVPVRARDDVAYEVTLQLVRGGVAFGEVDADGVWAELDRYLPRGRELLALRARDPDDVAVSGELRVEVRQERGWQRDDTGRGEWALVETAVLDAWGDGGIGVRAQR